MRETGYFSRYSDGLDDRGSIPGRGKIFLFSTEFRTAVGPAQPPIQWELGSASHGVKQPGREADHSSQCSAEVKKSGPIPPLPNTSSWRGV
jgi:hypothetical protein